MKVRSFLAMPFVLLAELVRMLFWPVLITGVCWLFAPWNVFLVVAAVAAVYTAIVLLIWRIRLVASFRAMSRGPIVITSMAAERRRGRRRRGEG